MDFIVLFFAFCLFCLVLVKLRKKTRSLNLPPGPRPLPIIGNMHQLYGAATHHRLRELAKKYGPLMHLQLGEVLTIVISSAEVAKEVYRTHDRHFSQRPSCFETLRTFTYDFTGIVFAPYGNYWRELRKIFTMELLSPKRVQTFRSTREEEALNLIKSIALQQGSVVNLSQKIFSFTYCLTSMIAFGKRNKYQERIEWLQEEASNLVAGFSIADLYPSIKLLRVLSGVEGKLHILHKELDGILQNTLDEHKQELIKRESHSGEAKDHLVDVLLKLQRIGDFEVPLTDDNLKANILDIFSAGSETSSTTLEWAIAETLKNPKILKKAQDEVRNVYDMRGNVDESRIDELKFLKAIVKETLRLHPPAPLLLPRECSEQCNIYGYEIPVQARIIVNAWAIARDPKLWNEPEKFNPERFLGSEVDYKGNDFQYIPFGAGRRMCPGISYAQPNIILPFAQLLFHFDWKLPDGLPFEDLDMDEREGLTIRRKDDLQLIPILNHRSALKKRSSYMNVIMYKV